MVNHIKNKYEQFKIFMSSKTDEEKIEINKIALLIVLMLFLILLYIGRNVFIFNEEIEVINITSKQRNLYILDAGHGYEGDCKGNIWKGQDSCFHEYKYVHEVRSILSNMLTKSQILHIMVDSQTLVRNMDINKRISIVNQYARKIKKLAPAHTTVLISLHANSSKNPMASGLEVFVNTKKKSLFSDGDLFEKHSEEAADLFADNLVQHTGLKLRSRGGKKHIKSFHARVGDIGILKRTECYAFLTENGFFSNEEDRALMSTRSFKIKVAYAHYATIMTMEGIEKFPIEEFLNN